MHTSNQFNTPFIRKLNHILSELQYTQIITWDSTGMMIDILDQKRIQMEVLPKFFRHSKFESFIRQLNLYGFKKIKKSNCHRFRHPDLDKGSSLFSIKSQRKNIFVSQNKQQKIDNSNNESQNISIENRNDKKADNSCEKEIEKVDNLKVKLINQQKQMNWFYNPLNYPIVYPNQMNFNNINFSQFYINQPIRNYPQNYISSGTNFNNLYFYN